MMGWGGGMWAFWCFGALLLVGLVLLVVVLVKVFSEGTGPAGGPHIGSGTARGREILDERFARGELSADEYREMRRALEDRS